MGARKGEKCQHVGNQEKKIAPGAHRAIMKEGNWRLGIGRRQSGYYTETTHLGGGRRVGALGMSGLFGGGALPGIVE